MIARLCASGSVRALASRLLLALAALLVPSPAAADLVNLSGRVTDQNGDGIFGVRINFVNSCTGAAADASGYITSVTGSFIATVQGAIYDLEFVPPAGTLFMAHRVREFDLTASRTLAPIALPYGITVSGRVTDAFGVGIAGVFARFFPPGASDRVFAVRDRTDLSGNYSVVIPPGTYDVKYGPPAGSRYLGLVLKSVSIPGNTGLLPVTLATGFLVSGTVVDGSGRPVVNVNLDALDLATGETVFLPNDRSDGSGAYRIALPAGSYVLDYKPQKCMLLVGRESAPLFVAADVPLEQVVLSPGVLVQGRVTDKRGAAVFDVNTNYIDSSGVQVVTFDDHTDSTGAYSAVVQAGVYNIDYAPPAGVRLAGVKLTGIEIRASTTLDPVQLPDGVAVSGRTRRVSGEPLAGIDLDFFDLSLPGDPKIYTPHDVTDAAGRFTVVVVTGSYDLRFEPPSASALAAQRLRGLQVGGDLALGDVVIIQGHVVTGRVLTTLGSPVGGADLDFFDSRTREKVETLHDNTDLDGAYSVVVPPRLYDVEFVPPRDLPLETGRITGVSITSDLGGLDAVLRGAALLVGSVRDPFSQGVGGVDLDLYLSGSGAPQAVSRDDTASDGSGSFAVYAPSGTYDIVFTPPSASGLAGTRLGGVTVEDETDLGSILLGWAFPPSVASIDPAAGPATGGTPVTVLGSGFQEGVKVALGGLDLIDPRVTGPGEIRALTPAYPLRSSGAVVDLVVANPGAAAASLAGAFAYTPAPASVRISVTRISPNLVLSWESTGQPFYTVFRSRSPSLFGQGQVLAITGSGVTTLTDVGADADGVDYFYRVE